MYYVIGVSAPSLHRESTDSRIELTCALYIILMCVNRAIKPWAAPMKLQGYHTRSSIYVQV